MSYTIEYNRQFIRSASGITPVWLAGESNVWESGAGHSRRSRAWSVFYNMLGVTQEELLAAIQPSLGHESQHWMKNGRWLDDKALLHWIKLGCKHAASIEDILLENRNKISSVRCSLSVWAGDGHRQSLFRDVKSTEEFDSWLGLAKAEMIAIRSRKNMVFPIVDFGVEDLRHPSAIDLCDDCKVLFRHKNSYLVELPSTESSSWSTDVRKAHVFSYEEALAIKGDHKYGWIAESRLVLAAIKEYPFNAVLCVKKGAYEGQYVLKRTRGKLYFTLMKEYAKHYATTAKAEKAKHRIEAAYATKGITLEIVIDEGGGNK